MSRLINPIIRKPTQGATFPLNKRAFRAHNGQGIVEFALVLPLLLLLLFGIMELGRFMIIYTAVHAASREGARYGSAAGLNDSGVPYYLDEEGIRAAAQRIAVLVGADVEPLVWDDGQGNEFDPLGIGSNVSLGDRVIVSVVARYDPILGLTPLQGFDIRSTTRRTIVKSVAIGPAGHTGGGPTDNAPYVNIETPTCPLDIFEPETLILTAVAGDVEDGDLTSAIVWYLDADPTVVCTGWSCSLPGLTPGNHTVSATVTDSDGRTPTSNHNCNVYVNPAPDLIITSPADNAHFVQGFPITFSATASELSPGDWNSAIQWSSDRDGNIGSGASFTYSNLSLGLHDITATVTDGDGQTASDLVSIVIVAITAPQLFIVAPANPSTFAEGESITFTGYATDGSGINISSQIEWSADPGGSLGRNAFITTSALSVGAHVITASLPAYPPYPLSTSILIYVVANIPPVVEITSPIEGFIAQPGQTISFSATADDVLDGDLANRIVWTSVPAGISHTGASFDISTLLAGTYTVTATATDDNGGTDNDSIVVYVHNPPVVTITAPVNNANLRWNTPSNFAGTATDYAGNSISGQIQWTSSIDPGLLGTGASVPLTLSAGTHTITATITDLYTGFSSSASIVVNVFQTICPTSGTTTWGPSRAYLSWNLIIPAQIPLDSVMSSLSLTWNAIGPTVSSVTVNGLTVFSPSPAAGSPVNVPGPVWSGNYPTTGYTLPVIFYFATRPGNNQGTFNLQATFEGCSAVLQASTIP